MAILLVPALASAQEKHPFTDSWFWGAKGGVVTFRTEIARTSAPVIGAEWLITRSKGALHVSLDQAYFDAQSVVANSPSGGVPRRVNIRDLRRFSASYYLMPWTYFGSVRPYIGLGMAFNFIPRAEPDGDNFASPAARDTVLQRINDAQSRGSLLGTLGVQAQYRRFAPFVQATVMPTQGRNEFLINGDGFTYHIEAGLRYNFGSSIERMK
jgi:hypothetical protein